MGPYLLLFAASVGLTAIIVESKITQPLREFFDDQANAGTTRLRRKVGAFFSSLMGCYQCSGFWAGVFVYLLIFGLDWGVLAGGFASSFLSVFVAALMNLIEAKTTISLPADPEDK